MLASSVWLSATGLILCAAYRRQLDSLFVRLSGFAIERVKRLFQPRDLPDENLILVTRLIASARAGISLDGALYELEKDKSLPLGLTFRLRKLLSDRPENDFLSTFLSGALKTGAPVLSPLASFQSILRSERKAALRARSMSSQSRAQAELLSYLPWVMLAGLAAVDRDWFLSAIHQPESWFVWAVALALAGAGRKWMRLILQRVLQPRDWKEKAEEECLPRLALQIYSQISLGKDAETALELSLQTIGAESSAGNQKQLIHCPAFLQLQSLLQHASRTGAPLREDLLSFVTDLYLQMEARWEERIQRLPVVMMAPLFLCFFPSSLLMLAGLIVPLLQEML